MYNFLIVISIIVSFFLVIAVLLQASKGDGLSGTLGGGSNLGSAFGARRTADFLSKITWWLGSILMILAVITNLFFLPGQSSSQQRESIIQSTQRVQAPSKSDLPTDFQQQLNNVTKKDTSK